MIFFYFQPPGLRRFRCGGAALGCDAFLRMKLRMREGLHEMPIFSGEFGANRNRNGIPLVRNAAKYLSDGAIVVGGELAVEHRPTDETGIGASFGEGHAERGAIKSGWEPGEPIV